MSQAFRALPLDPLEKEASFAHLQYPGCSSLSCLYVRFENLPKPTGAFSGEAEYGTEREVEERGRTKRRKRRGTRGESSMARYRYQYR